MIHFELEHSYHGGAECSLEAQQNQVTELRGKEFPEQVAEPTTTQIVTRPSF